MTTENIETYIVPVISTGHLEQHVAKAIHEDGDGNEWSIPVANYQYGCILFICSTAIPDDWPVSVKGIHAWAKEKGYYMVRLDCDADEVSDLPIYEW